jgi:adenosylhomocysteinase
MDDTRAMHGRRKIEWAASHMPLREALRARFEKDKPYLGHRIGMSIHLEAKTACLAMLLRDGGAEVAVTGSNPLSTQDDIAAALAQEDGITVHARHGVDRQEYTQHLERVLATRPDLILDDGGDLVALLQSGPPGEVIGGCEETTTGVHRLRQLDREGALRFPMFAVNDARMKYLFDNRYGTGQSVWDGIMRATNLLVAGKSVLVAGYGWCGRGIALRARGLGARVVISEVDPVRAVEAAMDGFGVRPLVEGIRDADFLVTATGCSGVVPEEALRHAKDGLLLANAGHFDVEIDKPSLNRLAATRGEARDGIETFTLKDGRRLYLLGEGRLVNLVLGDGHPVEIMDISFAVQALTLEHIVKNGPFAPALYAVPPAIDDQVARMKLAALRLRIDRLTPEQSAYLGVAPTPDASGRVK